MSAFPKREQARTSDGVSVGTTDTVVVSFWDSRQEITIVNDGANVVYLAFAKDRHATPVAVANKGVRLNANGGTWSSTTFTGAINAIAITGAVNVTIAEF